MPSLNVLVPNASASGAGGRATAHSAFDPMVRETTLQRMDNVLIVVEDLEVA